MVEEKRKELLFALREIPENLREYISQQNIDGFMDTDLDDLRKMIRWDKCLCNTNWPCSEDLEQLEQKTVYCNHCNKEWEVTKDEDGFNEYQLI